MADPIVSLAEEERVRKEISERGSHAQRFFAFLVVNGNTPVGSHIKVGVVCRALGIRPITAISVMSDMLHMGWAHVSPEGALGNEEILRSAFRTSYDVDVSVRVTEKGIAYWKDEIAVRIQTKQFDDMDRTAARSRNSFLISVGAFLVALSALVFAVLKKAPPEVLKVQLLPAQEGVAPSDANRLGRQDHIGPSPEAKAPSVVVECGPCEVPKP